MHTGPSWEAVIQNGHTLIQAALYNLEGDGIYDLSRVIREKTYPGAKGEITNGKEMVGAGLRWLVSY